MIITVLVDNISNDERLKAEWGLSFHISYKGHNILLDAGDSSAFAENADVLGIDISKVDLAVLSHGHHDHGDGFGEFCRRNPHCPVYIRDEVNENIYKLREEGYCYLGVSLDVLDQLEGQAKRVKGAIDIAEGVHILPHSTPNLGKLGKRENMFIRNGRLFKPDDFRHEHSLVIENEDNGGITVLNSCSHAGAYNIIDEVTKAFPDKPITAYLGGLHLFNKTDEEVLQFARLVKERQVGHIYTGHCTGEHAFELLKAELGEKVVLFNSGMQIRL